MTDKIPEETVSRNNPDDELLTAFLDGELSEAEKTETEKRLEADPRLRARLERLRAVDDFLNRLELLPTDREMTANTMEILTGVVQKEIRAAEARRRRFQFLFLLVVVLAAAGAFSWEPACFDGVFPPTTETLRSSPDTTRSRRSALSLS